MKTCTVPGFGRKHNSHGLCNSHYQRIRLGIKKGIDEPLINEGSPSGPAASAWKGGTKIVSGRVYVLSPGHPNPSQGKYVLRSRLVMEKMLGRYLTPDEHVHHKNEDSMDDSEENLQLMTPSEHAKHHINQNWKNGVMKNRKPRNTICAAKLKS